MWHRVNSAVPRRTSGRASSAASGGVPPEDADVPGRRPSAKQYHARDCAGAKRTGRRGAGHYGNVALLGRVTACNSDHGGGVGGTLRMLVPPIVQFCLLRVVPPVHRPPTNELKQVIAAACDDPAGGRPETHHQQGGN